MAQRHGIALARCVAPDRPPLTFLSLPREIRDEIYNSRLVSQSPIIVWKGKWKFKYTYFPRVGSQCMRLDTIISWRSVDQEATLKSLRSLDVNIILCNKTVSHEATLVFYKMNTFSFVGRHNWDPIVSWLETIGATNRELLVSMEIEAYRPDFVWQQPSGERYGGDPTGRTKEELYPRHPYLHLLTDERSLRDGRVANINPAAESIFRLLGRREMAQKVTIVMQLPDVYPGVRTEKFSEDTEHESGWYSMDLPNLVEKFRVLHTHRVEVLWKGRECRQELEDQRTTIENIGWAMTVLPIEDDEIHPQPEHHGCHRATEEWRLAKYILRRKGLTEPLLAVEPFLLTWE